MRDLASHYNRARDSYPNDRLIILFDVDGAIVDLRYMILSLLREYDRKRGSSFFRSLSLTDIDVTENRIEDLLARMSHLPDVRSIQCDAQWLTARSTTHLRRGHRGLFRTRYVELRSADG